MEYQDVQAPFNLLSPDLVAECVEEAYGIKLQALVFPYPSYVNRVYGLRDQDGVDYVVKFYRPGRWSQEAIAQEHRFLFQLADAECPVVLPLRDQEGLSLQTLALESSDGTEILFPFALFPKRGGRSFDAERDEDWLRLGALAGRIHSVGRWEPAPDRWALKPGLLETYAGELLSQGLVHSESEGDFKTVCSAAAGVFDTLLQRCRFFRIHGDFHRGNIFDRGEDGLLLIDFDDMCQGPAVQDLWLLLPGHVRESQRELNLIVEGYEEFSEFDRRELGLIEVLRFFRMVHFLRWQALQRFDEAFQKTFPNWGSRTFWIKEVEDLRDQLDEIAFS